MEFIFEKDKLSQLLNRLNPETPAHWGTMTAQHMVEHLLWAFRIMDGRSPVPQMIPDEKVPRIHERLRNPDWEMPMDFKAVFMPAEGLEPLQFENLDSAKAAFLHEVDGFEVFFEKNPDARPVHPYFGPCDKPLWTAIQNKHVFHHFKQFGLVGHAAAVV